MSKPRIFVTQPVADTALERLRKVAHVTVNRDASRIIGRTALIAGARKCDILFTKLHDKVDRRVIAANPGLRAIRNLGRIPAPSEQCVFRPEVRSPRDGD